MTKIDLSDVDISKFKLDSAKLSESLSRIQYPISNVTENLQRIMAESDKIAKETHRKKEQYEQDVLNTLRQIEGNTANLTTLVNLIQTSNDNQGEIIELVTELLTLAKEKDPEVVNSKYREIMNKITTFTNDAQTIATLAGFATMILNILKSGA